MRHCEAGILHHQHVSFINSSTTIRWLTSIVFFRQIVHGELAAKNVLLCESYVGKLSGLNSSRGRSSKVGNVRDVKTVLQVAITAMVIHPRLGGQVPEE